MTVCVAGIKKVGTIHGCPPRSPASAKPSGIDSESSFFASGRFCIVVMLNAKIGDKMDAVAVCVVVWARDCGSIELRLWLIELHLFYQNNVAKKRINYVYIY